MFEKFTQEFKNQRAFRAHCMATKKNGDFERVYTNAELLQALKKYKGNRSAAAREIGCSSATYNVRRKKDQIFEKEYQEVINGLSWRANSSE